MYKPWSDLQSVSVGNPLLDSFASTRGTKSDGDLKGDNSPESVTRIRAGFDMDKCVCCTIEKDQILVHSGGGKGYGIGALAITSGCYQWKVSSGLKVLNFFQLN